jgi:toxin ParE1/3/4
MNFRVLADAEQEIQDAMLYYEDCRTGLGLDFLSCVQDAMAAIQHAPLRFSLYEGRRLKRAFRRVLVSRFPYIVVYEARADETVVAAVAHTSREPGYWEDRQ